jgi:RNA polymerase sigma-70 factor (ECF subfamily)
VNVAALRIVHSDEPSDQELIALTLEGDGDAFGRIVIRFQKRIYRVACAILRDDMEADLVTQDTFVQAYTNLAKFEGRCSLETWLTRIAINRSRDAIRGRRWLPRSGRAAGQGSVAGPDPADGRPDAEREAISRQMHEAIERAVESLSAQQKLIFRLRHFEDRPLEEIAEALGLRSGTVRAHLFRAIHKVRKELSGWLPGGGTQKVHE